MIVCVVKGCENNIKGNYPLFDVPTLVTDQGNYLKALSRDRRKEWIAVTQWKAFKHKCPKVCSKHFVSGRPAPLGDCENTDWVPTLHLPPLKHHALVDDESDCFVPHCTNTFNTKGKQFFLFPKVEIYAHYIERNLVEDRRKAWIKAVDNPEKPVSKSRICSDHFIKGKPALLEDTLNPDWMPSLGLGELEDEEEEDSLDPVPEARAVISIKKQKGRSGARIGTKLQTQQLQLRRQLKDSIMQLCRNYVPYDNNCSVDALIGITVDDNDVILVNIQNTASKMTGIAGADSDNEEGGPSSGNRKRTYPAASANPYPTKRSKGMAYSNNVGLGQDIGQVGYTPMDDVVIKVEPDELTTVIPSMSEPAKRLSSSKLARCRLSDLVMGETQKAKPQVESLRAPTQAIKETMAKVMGGKSTVPLTFDMKTIQSIIFNEKGQAVVTNAISGVTYEDKGQANFKLGGSTTMDPLMLAASKPNISAKRYRCQICDRVYLSLDEFKIHVLSHKSDSSTALSVGFTDTMQQGSTAANAEASTSGEFNQSTVIKPPVEKTWEKRYRCQICDGTFLSLEEFRKHVLSHKPTSSPTKNAKREVFPKPIQEVIFTSSEISSNIPRGPLSSKSPTGTPINTGPIPIEDVTKKRTPSKAQIAAVTKIFSSRKSYGKDTSVQDATRPVLKSVLTGKVSALEKSRVTTSKVPESGKAIRNSTETELAESDVYKKGNESSSELNTGLPGLPAEQTILVSEISETTIDDREITFAEDTDDTAQPFSSAAYHCSICDVYFTSEESWLSHVSRTHVSSQQGNKALQALAVGSVQKSKESKASREKLACQECGMSFDSYSLLDAHTNMHYRRKPYKCSKCDKGFASKSLHERHEKVCGTY